MDILHNFYVKMQSEIMDMKEEMMNDAIDDVIGDEEDDEERYAISVSFAIKAHEYVYSTIALFSPKYKMIQNPYIFCFFYILLYYLPAT